MKTDVRLNKLQRSLPKFHQERTWNDMMVIKRQPILHFEENQAKNQIRESFLEDYYRYCELTNCYSCSLQKKTALKDMLQIAEKIEKREKELQEKALAEEQRIQKRLEKLL